MVEMQNNVVSLKYGVEVSFNLKNAYWITWDLHLFLVFMLKK